MSLNFREREKTVLAFALREPIGPVIRNFRNLDAATFVPMHGLKLPPHNLASSGFKLALDATTLDGV